MLADKDVIATIAVKDMAAARKFYEGKLGFKYAGGDDQGAMIYKSGSSSFLVYASQYAGTNAATAATWGVGDELESIVQTLKSAGVTFEHYDMPQVTRKGDIHLAGPLRIAWFKDPDGNILAMTS